MRELVTLNLKKDILVAQTAGIFITMINPLSVIDFLIFSRRLYSQFDAIFSETALQSSNSILIPSMCLVDNYCIDLTISMAIAAESNKPYVIGALLRSTFMSNFFLLLCIRSIIVSLTSSFEFPCIVPLFPIRYRQQFRYKEMGVISVVRCYEYL